VTDSGKSTSGHGSLAPAPRLRKDEGISEDNGMIRDLSVYAQGVYKVQLSSGKKLSASHRVDVKAKVDPATGEVRFYVDPDELDVLR